MRSKPIISLFAITLNLLAILYVKSFIAGGQANAGATSASIGNTKKMFGHDCEQ